LNASPHRFRSSVSPLTTDSLIRGENVLIDHALKQPNSLLAILHNQPALRRGFAQKVNPTHGSGWMVQIFSTSKPARSVCANPTNGSWWIVQILSTCSGDANARAGKQSIDIHHPEQAMSDFRRGQLSRTKM
jgi:hypothetical protein